MDIANAYTRWSRTYESDRNLTRDLDADATRSVIGNGPFSSIVEAGCGTGKNTAHFSRIAERVDALDFSTGMLEVARRNVTSPNVRFVETDLSSPWPSRSRSADLVSFNLVLEHIADLRPVLREACRVARPGGKVFISELHPFRQYEGSQATFSSAAGDEVKVDAHVHDVSAFLENASSFGLHLVRLDEWRHAEDRLERVPRLLTLLFRSASDRDAAN